MQPRVEPERSAGLHLVFHFISSCISLEHMLFQIYENPKYIYKGWIKIYDGGSIHCPLLKNRTAQTI